MAEQIYTIPVNEAFENALASEKPECPFCLLSEMLEKNELELILGASMMEPDIRIETNKKGFCREHFDKMMAAGNRLGLALMLESHLGQIEESLLRGGSLLDARGEHEAEKLRELDRSCYICDRVENQFSKMIGTAVWLWEREEAFREKTAGQTHFCLAHYEHFTKEARDNLSKKDFSVFYKTVSAIEKKAIAELKNDVSWFCKKFDYRYDSEPWYNARDAVPRAVHFLVGGTNKDNQ